MPVIIHVAEGTVERTCDVCGVEVLGVLVCTCGYNEHIYCLEHECTQCREKS